MNRLIKSFLIVTVIIVLYVIIINIIASNISSNQYFNNDSNENDQSNVVEIKTGNSVAISITRHRFYGNIQENGENDKTLYLFNLIKMPLVNGKINFIYTNILIMFVCLFILTFNLMLYIIERRKLSPLISSNI